MSAPARLIEVSDSIMARSPSIQPRLAAALMTYFAGRAVPLILIGFLIYLLVFKRSILRQVWWRYLLAIGIAALIALPMFVEIANTPGGEKRTEVVGGPLIELRNGNL